MRKERESGGGLGVCVSDTLESIHSKEFVAIDNIFFNQEKRQRGEEEGRERGGEGYCGNEYYSL